MAVPALSAAKTVCELLDWGVSNLALQKILYLAHQFHLGRTGTPLIEETFEAWDYGPVVPVVYQRARGFGSGPVRNVFHWIDPVAPGSSEYAALKEVAEWARDVPARRLVSITHWKEGAWNKFYRPGVRGVKIPNDSVLEEYKARVRAKEAA